MFINSGGTWSQQAKLVASDADVTDAFGYSVALDGDTAVIGAAFDDNIDMDTGSAYVFTRSGSTWTEQAQLLASDAAAGDNFGISVALSGNTALVGSYRSDGSGSNTGAAYVFTRSGSTWSQQAKLTASDETSGERFGNSVALSGNTALVGAHLDDDVESNSGSAYVFTRSGSTWSQQAKLTASNPGNNNKFGDSVALSGETAIIGATGYDNIAVDSGTAYIFVRSGTVWTEQGQLLAPDAGAFDSFGNSVGLSGDTAVVGAYQDDGIGTNSGSAYIFTRSGTTWTYKSKLIGPDEAADNNFGRAVAVEGTTALVGSTGNDSSTGAAYFFGP